MECDTPAYDKDRLFNTIREVAHIEDLDETKVRLAELHTTQELHGALGALALRGVAEMTRDDIEELAWIENFLPDDQTSIGALTLWHEGLHAARSEADMYAWQGLAIAPSFQHHLANSYKPLWSTHKPLAADFLMHKILKTGGDNQQFLDDTADVWGGLYRQLCVRRVAARGVQSHDGSTLPNPAESVASRLSHHLSEQYPGDAVRSAALVQAGTLEYKTGNEQRYFYHRFGEALDRQKFNYGNPKKLLSVARSIDQHIDKPDYIQGLSEFMMITLDEVDADKPADNRKAMEFLGGASFVTMAALKFAASKPSAKQKELQQIESVLGQGMQSRRHRVEQPSLASILELANGLLQSINDYLPDRQGLSRIAQPTIEGYYDAFDRILFVVNELSQSLEHAEDRQMIFDMSNIATSLVKHGAPRIKNRAVLSRVV